MGITPAPSDFTALIITSTASSVNDVGELRFTFTPSKLIPKGGFVVIDLKKAIVKVEEQQFRSSLAGSISYDNDKIRILTTADQSVASYNIVLEKVRNPRYSGVPGTIKLQTWMNDTNIIIDQRIDVDLPNVQPGVLVPPTILSHVTMQQVDLLSIDDVVLYQLMFSTTNSISMQGVLSIDWQAGGLGQCIVTSGLYDISKEKPVTCTIIGNQYQIRQFKSV